MSRLAALGAVALPVLFIFPYGYYRSLHPGFVDPLMTKIGIGDLDIWSLTHFGWYGGVGYFYPMHVPWVLTLGVVWEGIEHLLGEARPAILGGFGDCPGNINAQRHKKWWYGRPSDLVMNALGCCIGAYCLSETETITSILSHYRT